MLSKYNSVATERYLYTYTVFNGLLEGHAIMFWKCISMEIAGESMCLLYKHNILVNYFISRKNENYLARFIPFFETQIGFDLNAEDLLTEIVRDNR